MSRDENDVADRIMQLLDIGLASLKKGDVDTCLMSLKECNETGERLAAQKPVICLPDRSQEAP